MAKQNPLISVVSPVYGAGSLVKALVEANLTALRSITDEFEIILVEDGSPDNSWEEIQKVCEGEKKVRGIKLSRNFGQNYAITAGLNASKGEWVVVMDCDLQDRPEEIIRLYEKASEGYSIVYGRRTVRKDSWVKRLYSAIYHAAMKFLSGQVKDPSVSNFGIYHKSVIQAILSMKDHIRYFPIMVEWVGFSKAYVEVSHAERSDGKSAYSFGKMLQMASDNMIGFSDRPLRMIAQSGFLLTSLSLLTLIALLINVIWSVYPVHPHSFLILSIFLAIGIILLALGVVGIYLSKVFDKVKDRPAYLIEKELNSTNSTDV